MKRCNTTRAVAGLLAGLMTAASSQAGVIETDANYQISQVAYYQTIAQSFIAEDSAIKFAFYFTPMNLDWPNTLMIVRLVGSVKLLPGETYTASLDVTGDSPYWGVSTSERDYAGGTGYANYENVRDHDWTFRVTPVGQSAEMPEPTSVALFGLALGLAGWQLGRRRA